MRSDLFIFIKAFTSQLPSRFKLAQNIYKDSRQITLQSLEGDVFGNSSKRGECFSLSIIEKIGWPLFSKVGWEH